MSRTVRRLAALLAALMIGVPAAARAESLTFTSLDFPGATLTHPNDINALGEIVGQVNFPSSAHGFIFDGQDFSLFDFPGAAFTAAVGVNDLGQVVGVFAPTLNSGNQGYFYDGTSFHAFSFPGALQTDATGINNAGVIVGDYQDASLVFHGFRRRHEFHDDRFSRWRVVLPRGSQRTEPDGRSCQLWKYESGIRHRWDYVYADRSTGSLPDGPADQ
jgi:hypothetical protein